MRQRELGTGRGGEVMGMVLTRIVAFCVFCIAMGMMSFFLVWSIGQFLMVLTYQDVMSPRESISNVLKGIVAVVFGSLGAVVASCTIGLWTF